MSGWLHYHQIWASEGLFEFSVLLLKHVYCGSVSQHSSVSFPATAGSSKKKPPKKKKPAKHQKA